MGSGTLALVAVLTMVGPSKPLRVESVRLDKAGRVVDVQLVVEALDCKMVKPVDPSFKSKMPVATPDPNLALPTKIVPVPSCDPQRR